MKKQNLLKLLVLLTTTSTATTNAIANPRDNGIYIGINSSFLEFSADYFETSADRSAQGSLLNKTTKVFRDGGVGSQEIKLGYKHFNKNRVEIFRRSSEISAGNPEEIITSNTVGVNYEWGLASLASANKKVLPFISIGASSGTAKSSSNRLKLKEADAVELEAAIGIHYQLSKHFDTTLGIQHRKSVFLTDTPVDSTNLFTDGDIDSTSLNIGVSYHF